MKIGAQDKKKVAIMAVLVVIAVPSVIHTFRAFQSPAPAAATEPQASPTNQTSRQKGIPRLRDNSLDPTLHMDLLAAVQKVEYSGGNRNIFRMEEPPPPPPPKPAQNVRIMPQPQVEPPKPQIPLKFYGFSNRPGEPKKAFLQEGDNIFVAVEGDVIERRYKIIKITNTFVLVEDVLNNNQQTINLTTPPPTGF